MGSSKLKLLYILEMLKKHTDQDNILSMSDILSRLESLDIQAERKSINADINMLREYGYDVRMTRGDKYGYYLEERRFSLPEIKILVDSIQSARFISKDKSKEIIRKLLDELSENNAKIIESEVYLSGRIKAENDEVFSSIDLILKAIKSNRKIGFRYLEYNTDKKKKLRFDGYRFVLSPYALTWASDKYYLVANNSKYDNLTHYNIDRMTEVEILDEKRRDFSEVSEYRNSFNIAEYTRNLHGMMTGKIESVEIRFSKELTTAVIDKFGVDLTIKDIKEDTFVARVKAEISDAFISWLFTFGIKAEALTPDLRELMAQKASELNALYNLPSSKIE